jgi:predicted amidophosphoribosyltransferase
VPFAALVSLLAPPRCTACGSATESRRVLCARCWAALDAGRAGSSALAIGGGRLEVGWACEYSGVARDLVRALKFGKRTSAATAIAAAMAPLLPAATALVPVPAAPRRRRARGFDPAEVIANALARNCRCEVRHCLARGDGPRQVGRSRAERLADPPRVALISSPPSSAVLIDDVFTTGATLAASAQALGLVGVTACVFARAIAPIAERSRAEVRRR